MRYIAISFCHGRLLAADNTTEQANMQLSRSLCTSKKPRAIYTRFPRDFLSVSCWQFAGGLNKKHQINDCWRNVKETLDRSMSRGSASEWQQIGRISNTIDRRQEQQVDVFISQRRRHLRHRRRPRNRPASQLAISANQPTSN